MHDHSDKSKRSSHTSVQLWRWRLGRPGPHLTAALRVGEAVRGVVTRCSVDAGTGLMPDDMHHHGVEPHSHIYWLPGDEDGDGLIDHVWAYSRSGFPARVIGAMARVEFFRIGSDRFGLEPQWMSPLVSGGPFGPAKCWRAATPYVTPRWRLTKTGKERPAFTPDAQLLGEIKDRRLPEPVSISWVPSTWLGEEFVLASAFVMERLRATEPRTGAPPSDAVAAFPLVTFPEPVAGPLAFGFGAHFGLGQLMPVG